MSRDNEPVVGQWYQNVEEDETFRVLTVDDDWDDEDDEDYDDDHDDGRER